jgi:hypothetical protein
MTVERAFESVFEMASLIDLSVRGVEKCLVRFDKGDDGVDSCKMSFRIKKKHHYFMFPYFGYFQSPNQFHAAYYLRKFTKKGGGIFKPFKSAAVGYKWNYNKGESLYYFEQEF